MKYFFLIILFLYNEMPVHALEITKHENDHKNLNAIYLKGKIKKGDVYRLKSYISKLKKKRNIAVYLNSFGGNLIEGIKLGEFFKDAKIKTVIESKSICASACAIAFLGGFSKKGNYHWRTKSSDADLGFHTFYGLFNDNQQYTGKKANEGIRISQLLIMKMITYFDEMNVSKKLLEETLMTDSDEIYWVSNSKALDYGFNIWDVETKKMVDARKFLNMKR